MIDVIGVWLPQLIGYARLISDREMLEGAWLKGDRSKTSVSGYDELIEQIFDDLDSEATFAGAERDLSVDPDMVTLLEDFLGALSRFDKVQTSNPRLKSPEHILASDDWEKVEAASRRLVAYADEAGYPTRVNV